MFPAHIQFEAPQYTSSEHRLHLVLRRVELLLLLNNEAPLGHARAVLRVVNYGRDLELVVMLRQMVVLTFDGVVAKDDQTSANRYEDDEDDSPL